MKVFEIRDPIYGFIKISEWEKEIIDHPAFQRLRRIRQLGLTDMLYPGAVHTRFEHSIGVMHLATRMYDEIVNKEENRRILKDHLSYDEAGLKRDRQIVRLAALLHDLGHAPFSHASEELVPLRGGGKRHFRHEDYTVAVIKGPLKEVIEYHKLNDNYKIGAGEIANLIEGIGGRTSFWKILISSQLDADRCDYLLRDSLHIGVKYGIYDIERLLVTLALGINPETEDIILGIAKGGWHIAESLIIARYQMFTQVYYHRTRRAYDYMLKEALKETIGSYPSPGNIEEFLRYDDYSLWHIMSERNSEWFQKIFKRNHIRVIKETGEKPLNEEMEGIELLKARLKENEIWFWEDMPGEAKSWYKIEEGEEIKIIESNGKASPLSMHSTIVECLQKQFVQSRIYVKPEDRVKIYELGLV